MSFTQHTAHLSISDLPEVASPPKLATELLPEATSSLARPSNPARAHSLALRTLERLGVAGARWSGAEVLDGALVARARRAATYVVGIPGHANCGHQVPPNGLSVVYLATFQDGQHYDGETCAQGQCRKDACAGSAWVDCQDCAGDMSPPAILPMVRGCREGSHSIGLLLFGGIAVVVEAAGT